MAAVASEAGVWLVTGGSSGFGEAFTSTVRDTGQRIAATFRSKAQADAYTQVAPGFQLGLHVDVTDDAAVAAGLAQAIECFGRIDVLVNNAGIGGFGTLEEEPLSSLHSQMDCNLFGAIRMIKAVLPHMRARRKGTIVQMSSVSGLVGLPGLGAYAATKFALEGVSDALAAETADLGIHVLVVEPGPFRTNWVASAGRFCTPVSISDYVGGAPDVQIGRLRAMDGQQPGDPLKACRLIIEAVHSPSPPRRLVLGRIAIDRARERLRDVAADIDAWEAKSTATGL